MTKVLVTGAYGMLGQDLCPTLEDEGYEVIEILQYQKKGAYHINE